MHPPPPPPATAVCVCMGGLRFQINFQKKGRLTGPQLLEGGCWEREGGDFFHRGLQFSQKINK